MILKMKKLIYLAIVANLFALDVPRWFEKPEENPSGFYGLGTGRDIRSAKRNAIADLGSSIYLSVKSSFSTQTKRVDNELNSSATQNIDINTKELSLSNIAISKSECEDGVCYVRVDISKSDLVSQLRGRIVLALDEFKSLSSPFDFAYKKSVLFPQIVQDFSLFSSLGGIGIEIPKSVGIQPSFDLVFEYDGNFSNSFKSILENTIKNNITKYGKISKKSEWKILISVFQEDKNVSLEIIASHQGEEVYNASVNDYKKPNMSTSFFAKRLGVQTYKKINKWGKNSY